MKILLDENFPLQLHAARSTLRCEVEHIIILGQRGVADSVIRQRLVDEGLVFLTNDTEFLEQPTGASRVIVSRVTQSLPIAERVAIWVRGMRSFMDALPAADTFELLETGDIVAWHDVPHRS